MSTIHDLVGAYCTDALNPDEEAEFEEHLATCVLCAEQVMAFRESLYDLAVTASVTPPVGVSQQILGQVSPAPRRSGWRLAGAVAAAIAVFTAGALVGRSTAEPAPDSQIVALASAPDARLLTVDMMGTRGTVVKSQRMGEAAFLASDLPIPAKGMCYQIWKVAPDGTKTSAGVVQPDASGHVALLLDTTGQTQSYVVTLEPPGGSKQPTGEMVGRVGA